MVKKWWALALIMKGRLMQEMIPAWVEGVLQPVEKLAAHLDGLRHKAVSVFVTRGDQLLIQQRALGKYHTPGLWANTCCTHPHWGEADIDCAERRLRQEMGIAGVELHPVGAVEYRADVGGGMVEHEVAAVFRGEAGAEVGITADPGEVMAWRWVEISGLQREIIATPQVFTPWLRIYMAGYRAQILGEKGQAWSQTR